MEAGLSLGSNLGDRQAALREAVRRLTALPGTRLLEMAPLYETDPVGARPEYAHLKYLNTVVILDVSPDLAALSTAVHAIEDALGRRRTDDRNAPRVIDIDILYAGEITQSNGILDLPHPRWAQRRFVLQPLADVRPDLRLPGAAGSVAELLAALPAGESVHRIADTWL